MSRCSILKLQTLFMKGTAHERVSAGERAALLRETATRNESERMRTEPIGGGEQWTSGGPSPARFY